MAQRFCQLMTYRPHHIMIVAPRFDVHAPTSCKAGWYEYNVLSGARELDGFKTEAECKEHLGHVIWL